jgi:hypothetical protein
MNNTQELNTRVPTTQEIEQRALNCRVYGGAYCNPSIQKILADTERLVNRDYNVDPTKIKNDYIQFIPQQGEFGRFTADGSYYKY